VCVVGRPVAGTQHDGGHSLPGCAGQLIAAAMADTTTSAA
jgi:hypothetical protein